MWKYKQINNRFPISGLKVEEQNDDEIVLKIKNKFSST